MARIHYPVRLRTAVDQEFPVEVTRLVDERTFREALEQAGGDRRRLRAQPDGTMLVLSEPLRGESGLRRTRS